MYSNLDYHLHQFSIEGSKDGEVTKFGIPSDDFDDDDDRVAPGWEVGISKYFQRPGDTALYEYDFGDNWEHEVLLDGILLAEKGVKYPVCKAGERACPPEDCHGPHGYGLLLEALADRAHEKHDEMNDWLKGHAKNYFPFDPEAFNPKHVAFDDPRERLKMAFSEDE